VERDVFEFSVSAADTPSALCDRRQVNYRGAQRSCVVRFEACLTGISMADFYG
jgi:hypothetical protein